MTRDELVERRSLARLDAVRHSVRPPFGQPAVEPILRPDGDAIATRPVQQALPRFLSSVAEDEGARDPEMLVVRHRAPEHSLPPVNKQIVVSQAVSQTTTTTRI